jgi:hypothetical protein
MHSRPFHHTQVDYARWCILLTLPKEPTLIKKKISQISNRQLIPMNGKKVLAKEQ